MKKTIQAFGAATLALMVTGCFDDSPKKARFHAPEHTIRSLEDVGATFEVEISYFTKAQAQDYRDKLLDAKYIIQTVSQDYRPLEVSKIKDPYLRDIVHPMAVGFNESLEKAEKKWDEKTKVARTHTDKAVIELSGRVAGFEENLSKHQSHMEPYVKAVMSIEQKLNEADKAIDEVNQELTSAMNKLILDESLPLRTSNRYYNYINVSSNTPNKAGTCSNRYRYEHIRYQENNRCYSVRFNKTIESAKGFEGLKSKAEDVIKRSNRLSVDREGINELARKARLQERDQFTIASNKFGAPRDNKSRASTVHKEIEVLEAFFKRAYSPVTRAEFLKGDVGLETFANLVMEPALKVSQEGYKAYPLKKHALASFDSEFPLEYSKYDYAYVHVAVDTVKRKAAMADVYSQLIDMTEKPQKEGTEVLVLDFTKNNSSGGGLQNGLASNMRFLFVDDLENAVKH